MAPAFTDLANMFKHYYRDGGVEDTSLNETVWAKRVKKVPDFFGDQYEYPTPFAPGAGRSRTFATAQTNASAVQIKKWAVTITEDFTVWTINSRAIAASENNRGAFVRSQTLVADMHLRNLGKSFSNGLYGRVGGAIGQIATNGISSATATLTYAHDVKNFYPGQKIDVSAANTSSAAARAGSPLTVLSVDYDGGTVTFTAGIVATVGGAQAADYFIAADDDALSIAGLQEWLQLTSSPSALFGVTRTTDPQRLGGHFVDNANGDPAENLITLGQKVAVGGPGRNQIVLTNPQHYGSLIKGLGSKVTYTRASDSNAQGKMLMGATGASVGLSSGLAEIVVDPDCPGGRLFLLDEDTWEFHHLGDVPHIAMEDGRDSLRGSNYDGVEMRARIWGNLLCTNPFKNGTASCSL